MNKIVSINFGKLWRICVGCMIGFIFMCGMISIIKYIHTFANQL